jgi:pimeloyl-ACP methyl ester carboxylesterase
MTDLSKGSWFAQTDQLLSTDRMEIGGTYFPDRVRIEGVGIPLVSKGPGRTEPWSPDKHYFGVTALARISGSNCSIEIRDPGLTTSTSLAGESRPLAADFSAPMALGITEEKPQKFGLLALLRTDRFLQDAKLIMVEPYRPNRQPIILVHGLMDSPISWTPMINALNANPEIRRKYQIWVFRYPSGLPFPMSASLLRQELAAVYQKYPDTPKAVVIGHSMGGLLAHMLICDSGDDFCQDVLGKPLDQFNIEPDEKATVKGALYFKTSPYVAEAIFMATPHRGAELASNPLGRLGAALVRLPGNLVTMGPKLIGRMNETEGETLLRRFPNSIDTLRPEARVVKALNELKITSSIPYYSIIGDRGGGDGKNSSDGVVPYESSHLDGAKSELIVPSDHIVQQNSQAIAEVQRILLTP